jgi:hypothetical protein
MQSSTHAPISMNPRAIPPSSELMNAQPFMTAAKQRMAPMARLRQPRTGSVQLLSLANDTDAFMERIVPDRDRQFRDADQKCGSYGKNQVTKESLFNTHVIK